MKLKTKRICSLLLCVILILPLILIRVSAYERKDHDKLVLEILFRKFEYACNDSSVEDELSALTSACYLTIDQFNSYGQRYLDELNAYGVKEIPTQVNEIGYSASPNTHRDYTHRGWDFDYGGEMKVKWPLRQDILRRTVDTIFDFDGNEKQKEAFCELLYYVHILGDHLDDTSYKISNGRKIDVGGRHDKEDMIHKLLDAFQVLFANQTHTYKYRTLTAKLRSINNKFDMLVNSEGGINSNEKFEQHKQLVHELKNVLSLYVPELLKKEVFFSETFYNNSASSSILDWLSNLLAIL